MNNRKLIIVLISILLLTSCSANKKNIHYQSLLLKDTNSFNILIGQFANHIEKIWGINEILIAGPKDYVKYSDQYHTRSHINFNTGNIIIETISEKFPKFHLRQAIISTLLIREYSSSNSDLYSYNNKIKIRKKPLLYGQVIDNTGKPIRWYDRAANFADYLIKNKIKKRNTSSFNQIWSVTISMIANHLNKRAHKYLKIIYKYSKKYDIDQSLILAIIHIESSFNPYAISHTNALGLMQVVQKTAGKDVFRMKGKWGKPTRNYLLDPENNIDIGTAYIALLQNNYLARIKNPISRKYAVIISYNSGPSNVLKVFSNDNNKAFNIINHMTPHAVYQKLIHSHPLEESRYYLDKVSNAQKKYSHSW